MADLLPGESQVEEGGSILTSRNWASTTLHHVAEYTWYGSFPHTTSAFDFGRAIGRALSNCDEDNPYKEMVRGFMHYQQIKGE